MVVAVTASALTVSTLGGRTYIDYRGCHASTLASSTGPHSLWHLEKIVHLNG